MSEHSPHNQPCDLDIYKEHYAQFRSMNGILYQLPVIFSSIIGALFYFAFSFLERSEVVSAVVMVFAAVVAMLGVVIVHRFGLAFSAYIDSINRFDGPHKISLQSSISPSVIWVIKCLLVIAVIMSISAVIGIHADIIAVTPAASCN